MIRFRNPRLAGLGFCFQYRSVFKSRSLLHLLREDRFKMELFKNHYSEYGLFNFAACQNVEEEPKKHSSMYR